MLFNNFHFHPCFILYRCSIYPLLRLNSASCVAVLLALKSHIYMIYQHCIMYYNSISCFVARPVLYFIHLQCEQCNLSCVKSMHAWSGPASSNLTQLNRRPATSDSDPVYGRWLSIVVLVSTQSISPHLQFRVQGNIIIIQLASS